MLENVYELNTLYENQIQQNTELTQRLSALTNELSERDVMAKEWRNTLGQIELKIADLEKENTSKAVFAYSLIY